MTTADRYPKKPTEILPLDGSLSRTYVRNMSTSNLSNERLDSIELGARQRHALMDRVVIELVQEVRRLRALLTQRHPSEGPS